MAYTAAEFVDAFDRAVETERRRVLRKIARANRRRLRPIPWSKLAGVAAAVLWVAAAVLWIVACAVMS